MIITRQFDYVVNVILGLWGQVTSLYFLLLILLTSLMCQRHVVIIMIYIYLSI